MATQVKYARANFEHLHTTGVQFSKDAVVDALASKASVTSKATIATVVSVTLVISVATVTAIISQTPDLTITAVRGTQGTKRSLGESSTTWWRSRRNGSRRGVL